MLWIILYYTEKLCIFPNIASSELCTVKSPTAVRMYFWCVTQEQGRSSRLASQDQPAVDERVTEGAHERLLVCKVDRQQEAWVKALRDLQPGGATHSKKFRTKTC